MAGAKKPFSVICFDENNNQLLCLHVQALSAMESFSVVANDAPERPFVMVASLDGHVTVGKGITFPGEGLVSAETVLEQPDVFR
ncbi:MAG: hypothetical protein ACREX4_22765 [Gammaproteobacteria bacterium]